MHGVFRFISILYKVFLAPAKWVEEKQMDPWFEDLISSKHMDKWQIGDKDERSADAKMSTKSLTDPKMKEQNLESVTAPMLHSPKKQDVSNLSSRKVNSISTPPINFLVYSGPIGPSPNQ